MGERILHLESPHPGRGVFEPLLRRYPDLVVTGSGAVVPLEDRAPEEVLAACLAEGVPVEGSQVRLTSRASG